MNDNEPRIMSHARMRALGWTPAEYGHTGKVTVSEWRHTSGWRCQHQGHISINYPWLLFDPAGRTVQTFSTLARLVSWLFDEPEARRYIDAHSCIVTTASGGRFRYWSLES